MTPAPFMSVSNFSHLKRVLSKFMADSGVTAEAAGIRLDRLMYKTMTDVEDDNPTVGTYEKNKLSAEVVAKFISNIAASRASLSPLSNKPEDCEAKTTVDVAQRLAELEAARSDVDIGDPYADYGQALQASVDQTGDVHASLRPDLAGLRKNIGTECDGGVLDSRFASSEFDTIITHREGRKRKVSNYLLINGYDRQWALHPQRFSFSVNLANSDAVFNNVRSITATRLIIPREIVEEKTISNVPKKTFEEPFDLQFPYLILKISEFQNVYKASNVASQNAFAHFIYDTSYTSPNGRGYIHMKPMQKETKTFLINPLASLDKLDVAIQRPSGTLLNASRDESKVLRFDWNNQVNMNRQLIMVTLVNYFDRNEYFTGDTVRFTNMSIGGTMDSFINREEGHDIMEFGTPNADGYVNSFYIRVPGSFNTATGFFDIDIAAVTAMMTHVGGIDYVNSPPDSLALVINASLQVTVSFEIVSEEDDVIF